MEEFAKVLADDENTFAVSLEKLALKKYAYNEVLSQIKIAFDRALRDISKRKTKNLLQAKRW